MVVVVESETAGRARERPNGRAIGVGKTGLKTKNGSKKRSRSVKKTIGEKTKRNFKITKDTAVGRGGGLMRGLARPIRTPYLASPLSHSADTVYTLEGDERCT